jgi:hypothetical protein
MGEWVGRYATITVELAVVLLIALSAYIIVASALDAIFGWGITDASRGFLDPLFPDTSKDPGDCDPNYGAC